MEWTDAAHVKSLSLIFVLRCRVNSLWKAPGHMHVRGRRAKYLPSTMRRRRPQVVTSRQNSRGHMDDLGCREGWWACRTGRCVLCMYGCCCSHEAVWSVCTWLMEACTGRRWKRVRDDLRWRCGSRWMARRRERHGAGTICWRLLEAAGGCWLKGAAEMLARQKTHGCQILDLRPTRSPSCQRKK